MVGIIDEAFMSRIHVSMNYPRIDLETTLKIWENFLQHFKAECTARGVEVLIERRKILEFAETHYKEHAASKSTWNGRQIRNAFQTAIALGKADSSQEGVGYVELKVQFFDEFARINRVYDSHDPYTMRYIDSGYGGSHINPSTGFASAQSQYSHPSPYDLQQPQYSHPGPYSLQQPRQFVFPEQPVGMSEGPSLAWPRLSRDERQKETGAVAGPVFYER